MTLEAEHTAIPAGGSGTINRVANPAGVVHMQKAPQNVVIRI